MTTNELTSVAIKVFSIYVLVQAILFIPSLTVAYSTFGLDRSNDPSEFLFWLLGASSIVLLIMITVFMWKLANHVATKASSANEERSSYGIALQTIGYIIGYLFQTIIGMTLIVKASGWARFIKWLRGAGLTEKP